MDPQDDMFAFGAMFAFFALIFCTVAGVAWYFSEAQRLKRGLAEAAQKPIAQLREGDVVRVVGTLKLGPGVLTAPLSQRSCALFFVRVLENRGKVPKEILRESKGIEFTLDDGTGTVLVRPERFELALLEDHKQRAGMWNDASPELREYLASKGQSTESTFGFKRALSCYEGTLEEGERVAVLGEVRFEVDPAPLTAGESYRDRAMRKVLVTPPSGVMLLSDEPDATA